MVRGKGYLIVGIFLGGLVILVLSSFFTNQVAAQQGMTSGPSNGFIALTASNRNQDVILWLIDTNKKTLLTYQLAENPARAKLTAARDIKQDLNIPDDVFFPNLKRSDEPTPQQVKEMWDKFKKENK